MNDPTQFHRRLFENQSSTNLGKLIIPPFRRDSKPLPWSGVPDRADRLLPAIIPVRTDVSAATFGRLRSANLSVLVSGYIALELSNHVFDIGEKASVTTEAGIWSPL